MRRLLVIGLGAGNPDYVTIQAIDALNQADVFFVFDKGEAKDDLVRFRREVCERFVTARAYRFVSITDPVRDPAPAGYKRGVLDWHRERARRLSERIAAEVPETGCGAFLVWGDPSLYDSTLRLVEIMRTEGSFPFDLEVIPGITSVQALAARYRIVLNAIGGSVHITTGRDLAENGLPANADSVVVMLDRGDGLKSMRNEDVEIYWAAYLGTPDEILVSGKARDVVEQIENIRSRERERNGWIMDTYLLRRTAPE